MISLTFFCSLSSAVTYEVDIKFYMYIYLTHPALHYQHVNLIHVVKHSVFQQITVSKINSL